MYTGLPYLTRCCFCVPLRHGLLVWAYGKLVFNMLFLGFGIIWVAVVGLFTRIDLNDHHMYGLILSISVLILCLSDLILNFVLVVGAHKKNTNLLRLFYRYALGHAVLFLTLGALIIALVISLMGTNHEAIGTVVAIFSAIYCTFIIIYAYQLLLVRSAIVKLIPNDPVHFSNHNTNPKCYMQVDFQPDDQKQETSTEKPAS